jgi:PIN domain nuclease of toxin-antitoxin system
MARYLLDTNIFTFLATNQNDCLTRDVDAILSNYENEFWMPLESVRELIVAHRAGKLISTVYDTPLDVVEAIERDFNIRIVNMDMNTMRTMAKLEINKAEEHYDPSDHVIIAQAMTMGLPLISSDHKFPFYEKQGLELIYNKVKSRKQGYL